MYTLE
jgi:hypothetical protein